MLGLLLSLAAFSSASAQMLDANCTVGGFYAPNAVACSNVYSDAACGTLYLNNSAVVAGGNGTRPSPCFNGTNGPSEDLKSMAIATCPKTCGYCCQTPAYSCNNSPCRTISPLLIRKPFQTRESSATRSLPECARMPAGEPSSPRTARMSVASVSSAGASTPLLTVHPSRPSVSQRDSNPS